MTKVFAMLTSQQKAKVESLEVSFASLEQLVADLDATLNNVYVRAETSDAVKSAMLALRHLAALEVERQSGEVESIHRG